MGIYKMSNNLGTRNSEQFDSDGLYPWCELPFTKDTNTGVK